MKYVLLISTAMALSIAAQAPAIAAESKWAPQVELEGKAGTSGRRLGVTKLMAPLWQDNDSMLFSDIRFKFDNQDSQEYNLGLGYREKINDSWILGGYGYFDRMRSDTENLYSQGTLGVEALSENNDLRANIYIPETTKHAAPGAASLIIKGNQLSVQGGFERALSGADFEIGQKVPVGFGDFRVYGGGYSFSANDFESVAGPRGRLELKLSDADIPQIPFGAQLTFGAELQRDDVRGTEGFGLVKLSIPLWQTENQSSLSALDKRMTNFIQRDVDIVSSNGGTEEAIIRGKKLDKVITIDSSENFVDGVNSADANSLIIVRGNVLSGTGTAFMKNGQLLISDGLFLEVTGATSGNSFYHAFDGDYGVVNAAGNGSNLVELSNNSAILGLQIENSTGSAIHGTNVENISLSDMLISNSGSYGINFDGVVSEINIFNVTIDGTVDDGINVDDGSNINIDYVDTNNIGDDAIELNNVIDANVTSSRILDTNDYGISIANSSNVTIDDTDVDDTGADGIIFWGTNHGLIVRNSQIDNAGNTGLEVHGVDSLYVENLDINNSGESGINIFGNTNNVFIFSTDITNSGGYGINFDGTNNNNSIGGITIDTAVQDGFNIDDGAVLQIDGITVINAGDEGIEVNGVDGVTITNANVSGSNDIGISFASATGINLSNSTSATSGTRGVYIGGAGVDATLSNVTANDNGAQGIDVEITSGSIALNNSTITNIGTTGLDLNGATFTASGSGNTIDNTGTRCTSAGSTITGSITYNTSSTCP